MRPAPAAVTTLPLRPLRPVLRHREPPLVPEVSGPEDASLFHLDSEDRERFHDSDFDEDEEGEEGDSDLDEVRAARGGAGGRLPCALTPMLARGRTSSRLPTARTGSPGTASGRGSITSATLETCTGHRQRWITWSAMPRGPPPARRPRRARTRGMRRGKATTRRRPEGEPPTPGPRRAGQRRGVMCTKTPASVHRREEGTCRRVSCVSGAASVAYGPTNMLWAARRRTTADKRTQDAGPLEHGRRGRWGPRSGGIVSDRHSLTRWILPRVSAEKSSDRCPRAGGGV